jgi:hypothetical protein
MDRDATLLLALGLLVVAAASVGVSGWVLFLRERRVIGDVTARAVDTTSEPHPGAREES